ncbi:hypothetical protein ACTXT7_010276 [Hymenolepis weldensis]
MHFVRPELVNEFVIELSVKDQAKEVLESLGFELVRKLHGFERLYLAKLPENSLKNASKIIRRIKRSAEIVLIEQQEKLIRTKRDFVTWNDPKYPDMWYLNRASLKDGNEVDLNVQEAWQLGYSGKGVVVTIMDDGLDHTHPDLAANYAEEASCDVNNGDRDPMPNTTNPDNKCPFAMGDSIHFTNRTGGDILEINPSDNANFAIEHFLSSYNVNEGI